MSPPRYGASDSKGNRCRSLTCSIGAANGCAIAPRIHRTTIRPSKKPSCKCSTKNNEVRMLSRFPALTLSVLVLACAGTAPAQEKKYDMTHVKYAGLKDEILKHRGKVVVVDFWAGY